MRVIDFYAGAGCASVGLRDAGMDVVAHVERNAAALATLRANGWSGVIGCDVDDLAGVSPPSLLRPRVPALPEADAWWMSAPCQPFSQAGNRDGADDDRDGYPAVLALVRRHRPRWVLLENVPGLTTHAKDGHPDPKRCPGCYFAGILDELRGLFPVVEHRILNAAWYGVPQSRNRVIVVCGPTSIVWPEPTHSDASLDEVKASGAYWSAMSAHDWTRDLGVGSDGRRPYETMRRALRLEPPAVIIGGGTRPHFAGDERRHRELSEEPSPTVPAWDGSGGPWVVPGVALSGNRTTAPDGSRPPHASSVDRPAPTVRSQNGTGLAVEFRAQWVEGDSKGRDQGAGPRGPLTRSVDRPGFTVSTVPGHLCSASEGEGGDEKPPWWYRAADPDAPCRTVGTRGTAAVLLDGVLDRPSPCVLTTEVKGAAMSTEGVRTSRGGLQRASDALQLGAGRRRLTEAECAVLQDFPPDYVFCGSTSEDVYRQIGNAAPARLVAAVARAVLAADRQTS